MPDKKYAQLSVIEKEIKNREKELNTDEYKNKVVNVFNDFEKTETIPEKMSDGEIKRYKNSLLIKNGDSYILAETRKQSKVLNTDEILTKFRNDVKDYIHKKPFTKTDIEKLMKEELKKEGLEYDRKKSFQENLEILLIKNNPFAKTVINEFEPEETTGVRVKSKSLTIEETGDYRDFIYTVENILKDNILNLVKISQIKSVLKEIEKLKEPLKEEIVKNKENFGKSPFISLNNILKLNSKLPSDEMNLAKETLASSFAKNEEMVKKTNAEIETKNILVIFQPFKSLKEIEELLNVKKNIVKQNKNIDSGKYNII